MIKIKQILDLQTALNNKLDDTQISTDILLGSSDTLIPSQKAVKTYIDNKTVSLSTGMNYKGTFDATTEVDFSSLGPATVGDLYSVIGSGVIEGIDLNAGDSIIVNATVTSVTGAEVDKIDSTESPDLAHWSSDVITDDTLATATDSNIPTALTVKTYVENTAATKEDPFEEFIQEFVPAVTPANTNIDFTLMLVTSTTYPIIVTINGETLKNSHVTHTAGTKLVTLNVPYALDATDVINIIYKVDITQTQTGQTITFDPNLDLNKQIEFYGGVGETATVLINSVSYVIGNVAGSFVFDIGGASEHTFTTVGESITVDTFVITWAG